MDKCQDCGTTLRILRGEVERLQAKNRRLLGRIETLEQRHREQSAGWFLARPERGDLHDHFARQLKALLREDTSEPGGAE